MKTLGYYNGNIDELDRMTVPMLDRACYFGDGIYDVTYSRNYRIFVLDEHIDHFFQSAGMIRIQPAFTRQWLRELLCGLVRRMDTGDLWVYFQLSRGTDLRSHAFPVSPSANLWVMLRPAGIRDVSLPMRCIGLEDTRFRHCNVKSLNLLPNVLATQAAVEAGVDECILFRDGYVTECAHSNLSILKNGVLLTHPADEWIYAGTGRAHLMAQCRRQGLGVEERLFTRAELLEADEVLVTSASALCAPVIELDGSPLGGRAPHTVRALQEALLRDYLEQTT